MKGLPVSPRTLCSGVLIALVASLCGCAIAELQNDIAQGQGRVDAKQEALAREQRTQATLVAQRDQLLADLRNREMTMAQLTERLERMRQLNAAAPAATPADRQRRDERARQLDDMSARARTLDQNAGLPAPEKARRAEALKEQTRKALEVLLIG